MAFTDNLVSGLLPRRRDSGSGRAYWVADAEAYSRDILERCASCREGLEVSGGTEAPALAGEVAAKPTGLQSQGLRAGSARTRRAGDTIACDIPGPAQAGYDPQVSLFDGMRASVRWCLDLSCRSDAGHPDHRRQRLLRQRARGQAIAR
jgi:hypothetical protein